MLFKRGGKEPHKDVEVLQKALGLGFNVVEWRRRQSFFPDEITVVRLMDSACVTVKVEQDLVRSGHPDIAVFAVLETFREQDCSKREGDELKPGYQLCVCPEHNYFGYVMCPECNKRVTYRDLLGRGIAKMTAPTQQQLNDPKWWPNGATHYSHISGAFLMWDGHKWFRLDDEGVLHSHLVSHESLTERPAKPEPKEWDGEGQLPPAGIKCEVWDYENNRWIPCKTFDAVTLSGERACTTIEPAGHYGALIWGIRFRPIRTKAEREREELKEIIRAAYFEGASDHVGGIEAAANAVFAWIEARREGE